GGGGRGGERGVCGGEGGGGGGTGGREAGQIAGTAREPAMTTHDKILIVDFGSQVTQLIARRVREEGVYSEIVPYQKAQEAFDAMRPKAVILSGGPASVHAPGAPLPPPTLYATGVPTL